MRRVDQLPRAWLRTTDHGEQFSRLSSEHKWSESPWAQPTRRLHSHRRHCTLNILSSLSSSILIWISCFLHFTNPVFNVHVQFKWYSNLDRFLSTFRQLALSRWCFHWLKGRKCIFVKLELQAGYFEQHETWEHDIKPCHYHYPLCSAGCWHPVLNHLGISSHFSSRIFVVVSVATTMQQQY